MTTKEIIKALSKADPSGDMKVHFYMYCSGSYAVIDQISVADPEDEVDGVMVLLDEWSDSSYLEEHAPSR